MTKILDCTLRDGYHINNNFSDECILDTLDCAEKCEIDYFEAGYKMPSCIKSSKTKLVIMVDAKNILEGKLFNLNSLPFCHPAFQPSMLDFIRVACYPEQIEIAINAVEKFKKEGFGVFLHLMTADKIKDYSILKSWKNKDILESLYFADTFGAFMPEDVETVYEKLQDCGFEKISFHAHNNLQLAFTNTIKAIELGAYSVDASVFGIGRGAGNLPLELLLKYLNRDNSPYLELIKKHYIDIQKKHNWGYNLETLTCGLNNIHP